MSNIKENVERVTALLPEGVKLVAVSKFHPVEELTEAYEAGQRLFGENRAQELVAKAPLLPKDIRWHFIGHLQKNKVRAIMPYVTVIESVDSVELLRLIEKAATACGTGGNQEWIQCRRGSTSRRGRRTHRESPARSRLRCHGNGLADR